MDRMGRQIQIYLSESTFFITSIRIIILIMRFIRKCMFMVLVTDISALDNRQCHWNSTGNWIRIFELQKTQIYRSGQNFNAKMEDEILNWDLFEIQLPLQILSQPSHHIDSKKKWGLQYLSSQTKQWKKQGQKRAHLR